MSYKISICIPTYNRELYIVEALDSVLNQSNSEEIEIVISDNASNDNTKTIIQNYMQQYPNIKYYRWENNVGPDKNFIKVVDLASGTYCWLLGSDDTLQPGSISRMLHEIESNFDIYLFNRVECDINLKPKGTKIWLDKKIRDRHFNLTNKLEFLEYLGYARSIGSLFSYLSSIVVKKNKWDSVPYYEKYTGTCYAHVSKLLSLIPKGCSLKYIVDPLVNCRGENDSFSTDGVIKRFLIDIDGYLIFARDLTRNNKEQELFLRVLTYEHRWWRLLKIKYYSKKLDWDILKLKLIQVGYSKTILTVCSILGSIKPLIYYALKIKRMFYRL